MRDLEQSLVLRGVDKFSEPAKRVARAGEVLAQRLGEGQRAINDLGRQSKAIERLQALDGKLSGTSGKLAEARGEVTNLRRLMRRAGDGAVAYAGDLAKAKASVRRLGEAERKLQAQTASAHDELKRAGINTADLAGEHQRLQRSIAKTTGEMRGLAQASANVDAAQERLDRSLQRQSNLTIAAAGLHRTGGALLSSLGTPLNQMRGVEAARGELASLDVSESGQQAVIAAGRETSAKYAGINTADFTRAAYDIQSGISGLSDQGLADLTRLSAVTAKATKADVGQMTGLLATAYGTYKETLFDDASDSEFASQFTASLAASVKAFKTDGGKMQQAIQSMGSGLAASGISLDQQLTGLGMLQQKMEAGEAGTALKAIERTAASAQERFAKMGMSIETLDANGNLRALPDLLEEMQAAFGTEYTTEVGDLLKQGFGSDEAVAFFKALWGQQDAFRANAATLRDAADQGERYTAAMAANLDNNWDARLTIIGQRWDGIMERLGYQLVPILERVMPIVESVVDGIGRFIDNNAGLTWCWAQDNDAAGRRFTRKFVARMREAGLQVSAAQVPARLGKQDWDELALADRLSEADLDEYRYHGALLIAESAPEKALLMYHRNERQSFPFEFGERMYWFALNEAKYQKAREALEDNDELTDEEKRDKALQEAKSLRQIANCAFRALY